MPIIRVAGTGGGPLPLATEADISKLKIWWISGIARTSSGKQPFKIMSGKDFKAVHHTLIGCHRDYDEILTITSPEGVEMTEAEFYKLWSTEKGRGDA